MNTTHIKEPTEKKEKLTATRLLDDLDLRDYFAAKAMQGAMANPEVKETAGARSEWAYEIADAMLKEREK